MEWWVELRLPRIVFSDHFSSRLSSAGLEEVGLRERVRYLTLVSVSSAQKDLVKSGVIIRRGRMRISSQFHFF